MTNPDHRLTEFEIALSHAERTIEELSDVMRAQADRVAHLERRSTVIAARLAALDEGAPPPVDRPPPHW
jgi:uncharacterized coiled-coil protein SlyX